MNEENNSLTLKKLIGAVILFVGLGLGLNAFLSYTQNSSLQSAVAERAHTGDEILQLNKEQNEQLRVLLEKLESIESKLEKLEKSTK